mgnify:FL=1
MVNKNISKDNKQSSAMWGGRFDSKPSKIMENINASISFDKRLYKEDILTSIAHTKMLGKQKILSKEETSKIINGLNQIQKEIESNKFTFSSELEDIHMNIEDRLKNIIGEPAGKLHTARSRNDQVATDLRLWTRNAIKTIDHCLKALQKELIDLAEKNYSTIMPGFTHLQIAQPVTFGHYLLAYVEMFGRDRSRYFDCSNRLNENPLGSAALAGTAFPIDRTFTTKELNFSSTSSNSIDSVSDRDFVIEFLSVSSITSIHLSRMAEEIVIWSTDQFNFIKLSDQYTTGSSIMPQKRNPDAAELARGKSGRIIGSLVAIMTVLKGLPLAYSKDLQEDKEGIFDAFDHLYLSLNACIGMISDLEVNRTAMLSSACLGYSTATDLADWLVMELNIPFREAHSHSGKAVKYAEKNKCSLKDIPIEAFREIDNRINNKVYSFLSIESSVNSKNSYGGTSPKEVKKQIKNARKRFLS